MRIVLSTITAFCLASTAALACDDHVGKCEIEDWNYSYTSMMKALTIDGVATCDAGEVRLRLYDGEGDDRKFLAVDTAYIEGHIFKALVLPVESKPKALSIKYSIKPN